MLPSFFDLYTSSYAQAILDHNPPIYISSIGRMSGVYQHFQILLAEKESHELFAQPGLELQSS
jgi:hypothetical protein